ncbi:uncharacterized protein [Solanum lycopersicum]|uniref:uncharacterized protein n=1 Tax=Solanum lycopersicum TaxID=4081 RepID=UPI00374821B7
MVCEPIFKLLKKDAPTKWTEECQIAFNAIKNYLSNPPVLISPQERSPLFLYLSVSDSAFGCVLGQLDDTGNKEKKAIKAHALADHLAENPVDKEYEPLKTYFHDEEVSFVGEDISEAYPVWRIFFDGAKNHQEKSYRSSLSDRIWLKMVIDMNVYELLVIGDSNLLIHQVHGEWDVKNPNIIPYHPDTNYIDPLDIELKEHSIHCSHVEVEQDGLPWYLNIKKYLESENYLEDATSNQKKSIRRMALNFFLSGEVLYRRTPDLGLLRCVDVVEAVNLLNKYMLEFVERI